MPNNAESNKRKNLFINPPYQYRFLAFMVGLGIICAAIFYGATHYYLAVFEKLASNTDLPKGHPLFQFIAKQQIVSKAIFAVLGVVIVVLLGVAGVVFSHRTAGPLFRLQQHMDRIAKGGSLDPVQFRPEDSFQELAHSFNGMVERIKSGKKP